MDEPIRETISSLIRDMRKTTSKVIRSAKEPNLTQADIDCLHTLQVEASRLSGYARLVVDKLTGRTETDPRE